MRAGALALLLIASGCDHSPTAPSAPIGSPFKIGAGQAVRLGSAGIELGFEEVLEDSRCPIDAICVWGGMARLRVWLKHNGARREIELKTDSPQPLRVDEFEIDVQDLQPFPISTVRFDQRDYVATLVVTRR